jgi:hypothetical protein
MIFQGKPVLLLPVTAVIGMARQLRYASSQDKQAI